VGAGGSNCQSPEVDEKLTRRAGDVSESALIEAVRGEASVARSTLSGHDAERCESRTGRGGQPGCDGLQPLPKWPAYLQVPVKTLYTWRYKDGSSPVGRHLRYRWEDVEDWLASTMVAG
jgi:hypothetical protein